MTEVKNLQVGKKLKRNETPIYILRLLTVRDKKEQMKISMVY